MMHDPRALRRLLPLMKKKSWPHDGKGEFGSRIRFHLHWRLVGFGIMAVIALVIGASDLLEYLFAK
jgi:hypothetical protein